MNHFTNTSKIQLLHHRTSHSKRTTKGWKQTRAIINKEQELEINKTKRISNKIQNNKQNQEDNVNETKIILGIEKKIGVFTNLLFLIITTFILDLRAVFVYLGSRRAGGWFPTQRRQWRQPSALAWSSQRCSRTGDGVCGTRCGTADVGTCSQGPRQTAALGSSLGTWQTPQGIPVMSGRFD